MACAAWVLLPRPSRAAVGLGYERALILCCYRQVQGEKYARVNQDSGCFLTHFCEHRAGSRHLGVVVARSKVTNPLA